MGARPMQRVIDDKIKRPLSREILFGRLINGGIVKIDYVNNDLVFEYMDPLPIAPSLPVTDEEVIED